MSTAAIGKPLDRVDGPLKVAGAARFAAEATYPDLLHAVMVLSGIPKGKIRTIDDRAARQAPGVVAVISHQNAPTLKVPKLFDPSGAGYNMTTLPVLNTDRVFWHGQPVAVVVADTLEHARHGASLVAVSYAAEPAAVALDERRSEAFVPETILGEEPEVKIGDAEGALKRAAVRVDQTYTTPRENHNPIEPHAAVAAWQGGKLTMHDSSQFVNGVRGMMAEAFGIAKEEVRVLAPFVGGGFGGKGGGWPYLTVVAVAAKVVNRPVKLVVAREQMYGCLGYRTPTEQRVALGADRDGKLSALIHTGTSTTSNTNMFTEPFTFPARHLYSCPNIHLKQELVKLDVGPPTFMRAPGESPGTFALESALDELAYALKMDPVELRRRNEPDKDPSKGKPFSSRQMLAAYKLGAEKFGWDRRNPEPRSMRDGRYLVGMGVATAMYPVYQMPAQAKVIIRADGSALVQSACHEMGMGTATVQTQNAADQLGLPVERVRFELGDTNFPFAAVAGGSATTISVGAAVIAACAAAKAELIKLAKAGPGAKLADVPDEAIVTGDGGLHAKDEPGRGETFASILGRHGRQSIEGSGGNKPPPRGKEPFSMQSYGAQFCEVRVDPDLGEVRIKRFVGAFDVGKMLNAKTGRSQLIGGITMGIGMALMEETHVDRRNGRVVNASLAEYLVPVHADIPDLEAYWVDLPDPHTPLGAHGIGEIGITGVAAAVANAVYHATGKRIRKLPITPDQLL